MSQIQIVTDMILLFTFTILINILIDIRFYFSVLCAFFLQSVNVPIDLKLSALAEDRRLAAIDQSFLQDIRS